MKSSYIVFLCLFIVFNSHSQNSYQKDFEAFRKILETNHPSLYYYTSKSEFDNYFESKAKECSSINNDIDFFKLLGQGIEKIGCGHTSLNPSEAIIMKMITGKFFPYPIKIIGDKVYSLAEGTGQGKAIAKINDEPINLLLSKMYGWLGADGKNILYKNTKIEESFGGYLYFLNPEDSIFKIEFEDLKNQIVTNGIDFEHFRKVTFEALINYDYHKNTQSFGFKYIGETGILKVDEFGFKNEQANKFKSFLDSTFSVLKKLKTENLIIDIRNNTGGSRQLAIYLYSYLTSKKFRQRESMSINRLQIDSAYLDSNFAAKIEFFNRLVADRFGEHPTIEMDHLSDLMKPNPTIYQGNIYVLIGSRTFSAGGEFALNCKNNRQITLVGQETGAAFSNHNGDITFKYILPETLIELEVPMIHIEHFCEADNGSHTGIFPDYEVEKNITSILNYNDKELNFVLDLISKGIRK